MPQVTRLQKPCIGYYDRERHARVPCGRLCARSRCDEHEAMYQRTRRPPARERGYDAQYRRDRARVLAPDPVTGERPLCSLQLEGCAGYADTADHVDPLLGGKNVAARRGPLEPACAHCNSKRGSKPALHLRSRAGARALSADNSRDNGGALESSPSGGSAGASGGGVLMPDGSVR